MGKVRRKKNYRYATNRKRLWKKAKKRAHIPCAPLKEAWDESKTLSTNLHEMGLVLDPNKLLAVPSTKDMLGPKNEDKVSHKPSEPKPLKSFVISELEKEASMKKEVILKRSKQEVSFCTYMMDKYGEDYEAMARDRRNYFQHTPRQIEHRITAFKKCTEQYNAYLESKKSALQTNNT